MLYYASNLEEYRLQATDGELGKVKNWYFDDSNWIIRYAAVDTSKWLPGRKVLISPSAITGISEEDKDVKVRHDKETVKNSPDLNETEGISNDYELSLNEYYGWAPYWHGTDFWGQTSNPIVEELSGDQTELTTNKIEEMSNQNDYTLRDVDETKNHLTIYAENEKIGIADDLLIDEENWKIRYLVIRTDNNGEENHRFLSPDWIKSVDWQDEKLVLDISSNKIKNAPTYRNKKEITREEEKEIHKYYYKAPYWE